MRIMNIPKHIAIIMDVNGRWAKKHFLSRIQGHQKGVKAVREMVKNCDLLGVKTLTLFAFSSKLYFTATLWSDFDKSELDNAISRLGVRKEKAC